MPPASVWAPTRCVKAHTYHNVYGKYLGVWQKAVSKERPFKMLEIGLGCNMVYGPGASVSLSVAAVVWRCT